ncbi:MAG TPA: hypothetical protein VEH06_06720 [Candidatus Bathyarchaeia archaeon]|nr:hypothetical protein [Candidatus Bathyarchaeia archaeon]
MSVINENEIVGIFMTNEPSSEAHSDKELIFDAICINCNKRFTSMRGISMHLKMTAARHVVNFINYGNYDKKTGLREMNRPELNFNLSNKRSSNLH